VKACQPRAASFLAELAGAAKSAPNNAENPL
jgi:hypothetical protein